MVQKQRINSELKKWEKGSDNVWKQTQRQIKFRTKTSLCQLVSHINILKLPSTEVSNSNFDISFKMASGRLDFVTKLRLMLTPPAESTNYQTMVVPILTYASLCTLKLNITNEHKLDKLYSRETCVIACNRNPPQSMRSIKKIKAYLFFRRCLDDDICFKYKH